MVAGDPTVLHGLYRSERKRFAYMKIDGEEISHHEPGKINNLRFEIQYGQFHALPEKIARIRFDKKNIH